MRELLALLALSGALIAAGCGGDDATSTSPGSQQAAGGSTPSTSSGATPAAAPVPPGKKQTLAEVKEAEARIPIAKRKAAAKVARSATTSCVDSQEAREPKVPAHVKKLSPQLQDTQRALATAKETLAGLRKSLGSPPKTPKGRAVLAQAKARYEFVLRMNYAMERGDTAALGISTAGVEQSAQAMVKAARGSSVCKNQ